MAQCLVQAEFEAGEGPRKKHATAWAVGTIWDKSNKFNSISSHFTFFISTPSRPL
jgi:hypothetical protein